MRIGFFTSIDGWGGSELYLERLAAGISGQGHEAVLFGVRGTRLERHFRKMGFEFVPWRGSAAAKCDVAVRGEDPEVHVPGMRRLLRSVVPGWTALLVGNVREAMALSRIFRTTPVDVMHINVHGYEMAGVAASWAGLPTVATYHIHPEREPYWPRRCLIRRTARGYSRIIFVSHASAAAWRALYAIPKERSACVYNGIVAPARVHDVRPVKSDVGALNLLAAGRLHPMKGFDVLLDAVALLKDLHVRLEIAGSGEQEGALRNRAERLGITSRVNFCGHVEDMAALYRAADAFVLPSVRGEACPFVLLEAMCWSLPLITSDFGPLPEINRDGETGVVCRAGDAPALAGRIRELAVNASLRAAMGRAGRARVTRVYTEEQMLKNTLAVYEEARREHRMAR